MTSGISSWLGRRRLTDAATRAFELTYAGERIPPLRRGLPKSTGSVCPVCLKAIFARLVEEEGRVVMEKYCEQHGIFRDIYWSDVELYLKAEAYGRYQGKGLENPQVEGNGPCPTRCGLCRGHLSQTLSGNLDLTNRCNLGCSTCFAGAGFPGVV